MDIGFLSGGIYELQEAKAAVAESAKLQDALHAAEADAFGKEKALESQKKYVLDKADSAIKERRNKLKKAQDEQVEQANKNLKEAERKRKAAKTDAVQQRISSETSDIVAETDTLKQSVKNLFKENKIPGMCNTSYYYALYAPKRGVDFVYFVLTIVVAFGLIPNLVCLLLDTDKLIIKILVYLAVVVFFVAIYFLFFAISKRNKNGEVLEKAREMRDKIRANKKAIKKTSKSIIKDQDESTYGLEGYDSEIEEMQQIYNEAMKKRDSVLQAFDEGTAVQIREEIQKENQPVIDQMEEELIRSRQMLEEARTKATEASEILTNSYEVYLGKKNTSEEKIDGLIALIQEGRASTIMEALDIQNGEIKQ